MNAFQFFVHRTSALILNINSAPLNLPEGAFYSLDKAIKFAESIADKYNHTVVYNVSGTIHTVIPRKAKA